LILCGDSIGLMFHHVEQTLFCAFIPYLKIKELSLNPNNFEHVSMVTLLTKDCKLVEGVPTNTAQ